ncbi:MAG: YggT family protein [Chloroflexota bacterium]
MSIGVLLYFAIQTYIWILIARAIISWIPMFGGRVNPDNPLINAVYQITDPPLQILRQYIPSAGGLDLSFLVLFLLLSMLGRVVLSLPI